MRVNLPGDNFFTLIVTKVSSYKTAKWRNESNSPMMVYLEERSVIKAF